MPSATLLAPVWHHQLGPDKYSFCMGASKLKVQVLDMWQDPLTPASHCKQF